MPAGHAALQPPVRSRRTASRAVPGCSAISPRACYPARPETCSPSALSQRRAVHSAHRRIALAWHVEPGTGARTRWADIYVGSGVSQARVQDVNEDTSTAWVHPKAARQVRPMFLDVSSSQRLRDKPVELDPIGFCDSSIAQLGQLLT